jgi:type II secretory pathway component GspD/PulD (secretin)
MLSLPSATLVLAAHCIGQTHDVISAILDRSVEDFSIQGQEARIVLEGIGAAYRFPVIVDPDVLGTVSFEVHNASVRTLLEAICRPKGWSFEISADGYLLVRRFVTRIYPVDYLQMTQMGSSSASINLSESVGGGSSGVLSNTAVGQAQSGVTNLGAASAAGLENSSGASSGGTSTLSVTQQNDADFWGRLESDLHGMIGEGELLTVNRFAGLVQLRGSLRTQAIMGSYLRRVLARVGRQARISVRVVEVDLNDQSKAGIDWSTAAASIGRIAKTAITITSAATATSSISQLGSISLNPNTFTGTISAGNVQATINALSEQGTVRVESKPEVSALNNQTAFIQISEDEPFFSRTSTTTINAGGTAQAGTQPITNTNYSESTVSFGNVLEITVQISDDLTTKLSLSPALTELKGTVTSPDGQETAPITDTKRARTTVTLRNHETAVVGGFITETDADDRRGPSGLSEIPIVGRVFATTAKAKTRSELVFLVTVNAEDPSAIVPKDADGTDMSDSRSEDSAESNPTRDTHHVERIDLGGV